jgi:hypothetical protein
MISGRMASVSVWNAVTNGLPSLIAERLWTYRGAESCREGEAPAELWREGMAPRESVGATKRKRLQHRARADGRGNSANSPPPLCKRNDGPVDLTSHIISGAIVGARALSLATYTDPDKMPFHGQVAELADARDLKSRIG